MKTIRYDIIPSACCKCGKCAEVCPEGAIRLDPGKPASIIRDRCTSCGICAPQCKLRAIVKKRGLFM